MSTERTRPKFNDASLAATMASAAPWIDSVGEQLNRLSEDIKALEAYLLESGVRVEVSVGIGLRTALRWMEHAPKTWRIVWDDGDRRPLIEMPAATRLTARDHLPALLHAVAAKVVEAQP